MKSLVIPLEPAVDKITSWPAVVTTTAVEPSPDLAYQPVLCPFHDTPFSEGLSKTNVPYVYCQTYDKTCPFWLVGYKKAYACSSVVRLDHPNYYAYFYLKGKHLSRTYETWQAVSYRYCYNVSKMFRTTFLSRDSNSTYNSYIFY